MFRILVRLAMFQIIAKMFALNHLISDSDIIFVRYKWFKFYIIHFKFFYYIYYKLI